MKGSKSMYEYVLFEDCHNLYLCVFTKAECVAIQRFLIVNGKSQDGSFADIIKALRENPERFQEWHNDIEAAGLFYDRELINYARLIGLTQFGRWRLLDMSAAAKLIIDNAGLIPPAEDDQENEDDPGECEECSFSGLLEEE